MTFPSRRSFILTAAVVENERSSSSEINVTCAVEALWLRSLPVVFNRHAVSSSISLFGSSCCKASAVRKSVTVYGKVVKTKKKSFNLLNVGAV